MNFEEALTQMKNGKIITLPGQDYTLCLISKIYYDNDPGRECQILGVDSHILRNDWEIVE